MPAVLTHKAIMLLARERLRRLREQLDARILARIGANQPVTDTEYRVRFLARHAFEIMSGQPTPSVEVPPFPQSRFSGVSKFSVMGSMGPDIPAFAAFFRPGQKWPFDTVHKGTPSNHRELVVARTTDLVAKFWQSALEATGSLEEPRRAEVRGAARAYALGHLCHVAGDVLSHPYVNDVEWAKKGKDHEKFSHESTEGSMDAQVARQVFGRLTTREGQAWENWWPTAGEVPGELWTAYAEALNRTYEGEKEPPEGPFEFLFGDYLKEIREVTPVKIDAAFLADGYQMYRHGVVSVGYGHGQWGWVGLLAPLFLPFVLAHPLAAGFPNARAMFHTDVAENERTLPELLALPVGLSSLVFLGYGAWVVGLSSAGVDDRVSWGLLTLALNTFISIMYSIDVAADIGWPNWLRVLVTVVGPVASSLALLIGAIVDDERGHRAHRAILTAVFGMPYLYWHVFLCIGLIFFVPAAFIPADSDGGRIAYHVIMTVLLALGSFLLLALYLGKKARDARIPEEPESFAAEERHFVRLFDDASLYTDPDGDRCFPSGRRKLLELRWSGPGTLSVRFGTSQAQPATAAAPSPEDVVLVNRLQLQFRFENGGNTTDFEALPPMAPRTLLEFAARLSARVESQTGSTGGFTAAPVYPEDPTDRDRLENPDYELPPGALFGFPADAEEAEDLDTQLHLAGQFRRIGSGDDPYVLYHAPQSAHSLEFAPRGPTVLRRFEGVTVPGAGKVSVSGTRVTGDGSHFLTLFRPGDWLAVQVDDDDEEAGRVETVISDTEIELQAASAFDDDVSGRPYSRRARDREEELGYRYVQRPVVGADGHTIMDYAADLGSMMCMAMTPELLSFPAIPELLSLGPQGVAGGVGQVMRNWNLDRRRINEWRMIVAGGAHPEHRDGHPDPSLPRPPDERRQPAASLADAEELALEMGWIPLLRTWIDSLDDPAVSALDAGEIRPDGPSRRDLTRSLAFLFDLPEPVDVAP